MEGEEGLWRFPCELANKTAFESSTPTTTGLVRKVCLEKVTSVGRGKLNRREEEGGGARKALRGSPIRRKEVG